ncbi:MAG TPA: hypothetical protein VE953_17745 [Terriglobales bacterium]|nr:hypothetical protein [Terriglobales bacterium]
MPDGTRFRVSRRQAMKIGAGAVVVGAVGVDVAQRIAAAAEAAAVHGPAISSDPRHAQSGRVVEVDGNQVQVQVFGSGTLVSAPLVGFPDAVVPRVGDHVTLTDVVPGFEVAALPLVHWISGVPKVRTDQTIGIGGTRLLPTAPLLDASRLGAPVSVSVLDTSLATAQVFGVRGLPA